MERSEVQSAQARLAQLQADYHVDVLADWGDQPGEEWRPGSWKIAELDRLQNAIVLVANLMGGRESFVRNLGGLTVRKADIGSHGGEALRHRVSLSTKGMFSSWTVVHELAHAWDANHRWGLARQLEKYTGGYTSRVLSLALRLAGRSDSGRFGPEKKPGRYGRRPGCNAAGYFYGDKPSGSNWKFNRLEDFAESVAMYVGWERGNDLSQHARNRVIRYQLQNGDKDPFNVVDNWTDYSKLFYPDNGDYTKTRRWQFVDDLVNGRISVP
ncbi:MAG TPA: hypothetical protein VI524_03815 [Anaerolineales bacterium]|nr:hypothetical protein [Anaerolineales bacterium]